MSDLERLRRCAVQMANKFGGDDDGSATTDESADNEAAEEILTEEEQANIELALQKARPIIAEEGAKIEPRELVDFAYLCGLLGDHTELNVFIFAVISRWLDEASGATGSRQLAADDRVRLEAMRAGLTDLIMASEAPPDIPGFIESAKLTPNFENALSAIFAEFSADGNILTASETIKLLDILGNEYNDEAKAYFADHFSCNAAGELTRAGFFELYFAQCAEDVEEVKADLEKLGQPRFWEAEKAKDNDEDNDEDKDKDKNEDEDDNQ